MRLSGLILTSTMRMALGSLERGDYVFEKGVDGIPVQRRPDGNAESRRAGLGELAYLLDDLLRFAPIAPSALGGTARLHLEMHEGGALQ